MENILFTSESVSEGHPDKICDQISDAILDAILEQDKFARVACETFTTTNTVIVGGEVATTASYDVDKIVRNTLRDIGYTDEAIGINCDTCRVENLIHSQSPDIAQGVIQSDKTIGAGDQGIMFGFATNETDTYLPLPISIAHELVRFASKLRKNGKLKHARPDMKSQVTIDYTDNKNPKLDTVLMSVQHDDEIDFTVFKKSIEEQVIKPIINNYNLTIEGAQVLINPTGRFVIGGPDGDCGLTGRKIIVDTYGGSARHGGGAFSGKDATKVDRSGAYACRYIAKNVVASGLADKCEIQLSYAIGVSEPTSIALETFGTEKVEHAKILRAIRVHFNLTPGGIIEMLDLRSPIYLNTSVYGHFGRTDIEFSWEKIDKADAIRNYVQH